MSWEVPTFIAIENKSGYSLPLGVKMEVKLCGLEMFLKVHTVFERGMVHWHCTMGYLVSARDQGKQV